jgi:hypothetical protein
MLPQPRQRFHPKLNQYERGRANKGFLAAQIFFQEPNEPDSASVKSPRCSMRQGAIRLWRLAAHVATMAQTESVRRRLQIRFSVRQQTRSQR